MLITESLNLVLCCLSLTIVIIKCLYRSKKSCRVCSVIIWFNIMFILNGFVHNTIVHRYIRLFISVCIKSECRLGGQVRWCWWYSFIIHFLIMLYPNPLFITRDGVLVNGTVTFWVKDESFTLRQVCCVNVFNLFGEFVTPFGDKDCTTCQFIIFFFYCSRIIK